MMSGYLTSTPSLCEAKSKIIVSEEKGMKHIANNTGLCNVRQFRIDGGIIPTTDTSTIRCDYLVLNDDLRNAYFIELKRSGNLPEAIDQIHTSIEMLKNELPNYIYHGRIVGNSIHGIRDSKTIDKIRAHVKRYKGTIQHKTRNLAENI